MHKHTSQFIINLAHVSPVSTWVFIITMRIAVYNNAKSYSITCPRKNVLVHAILPFGTWKSIKPIQAMRPFVHIHSGNSIHPIRVVHCAHQLAFSLVSVCWIDFIDKWFLLEHKTTKHVLSLYAQFHQHYRDTDKNWNESNCSSSNWCVIDSWLAFRRVSEMKFDFAPSHFLRTVM